MATKGNKSQSEDKVNKGSISCKKLKLIEHQQGYVTGCCKIKAAV